VAKLFGNEVISFVVLPFGSAVEAIVSDFPIVELEAPTWRVIVANFTNDLVPSDA
jgi:hypothetical protein